MTSPSPEMKPLTKPCPFCKCPMVNMALAYVSSEPSYWAACHALFGCGAKGPPESTEEKAVEKWNHRCELESRVSQSVPPDKAVQQAHLVLNNDSRVCWCGQVHPLYATADEVPQSPAPEGATANTVARLDAIIETLGGKEFPQYAHRVQKAWEDAITLRRELEASRSSGEDQPSLAALRQRVAGMPSYSFAYAPACNNNPQIGPCMEKETIPEHGEYLERGPVLALIDAANTNATNPEKDHG